MNNVSPAKEQATIEYYHRAVYMPQWVLRKAVKKLNKACSHYPMELSKHFQQRIRQRKIDMNLITIDSIRDSKIIQVEILDGVVNKLLLRYNIGDKDLYICVCVNESLLLITSYTYKTNHKYDKQALIDTGKYVVKGVDTIE